MNLFVMNAKIPNINNLLAKLKYDPHWKDFRFVFNYFDKKTGKIINELLDNIPDKQEDYRLYLFEFIIRTRRIFSSIVLLAIYGKIADMTILRRPLLENIIQTKMLLKGRRTKSVRLINLYRLIIKLKEQRNLMEEPSEDYKDYNVLCEEPRYTYFKEIDKLENELTIYNEDEIYKMEKKVNKGLSWHGRSIKGAIKECNSIDDYEDYDDSCRFIHVRDHGLANLDHYCKDNYTKMHLFSIALSCLLHLDDYIKICPISFVLKRKTKQTNYVMMLAKLIGQNLIIVSPHFRKSIGKLNLISIN